jgi:hypothetical protein
LFVLLHFHVFIKRSFLVLTVFSSLVIPKEKFEANFVAPSESLLRVFLEAEILIDCGFASP